MVEGRGTVRDWMRATVRTVAILALIGALLPAAVLVMWAANATFTDAEINGFRPEAWLGASLSLSGFFALLGLLIGAPILALMVLLPEWSE